MRTRDWIIAALVLLPLARGVVARVPNADASFPAGWAGRWEGTLEIWGPGAAEPAQRVPLVREIAARPDADGAYRWRTVYEGDTTRNLKAYRLRAVDSAAGRWAIDEGNGIVLSARLVGGALVTVFEVGGRQFLSREARRGDTLDVEILYWSASPTDSTRAPAASGAPAAPNAERGATVRGYGLLGGQRARLVRAVGPRG